MGGVPTKHHSHSKVGRRRSQQALKKVNLVVCPTCKGPTLPHRICPNCGTYVKSGLKTKTEAPKAATAEK